MWKENWTDLTQLQSLNGQSYQQVWGKVTAYQYGKVDAFQPYSAVYHEGNDNIDDSYVDGSVVLVKFG